MCGIVGFVDYKFNLKEEDLTKMNLKLFHRGPDKGGQYFKSNKKCALGLGHRRLSIIDLTDKGDQPFVFDNLVLIFNGEVYNFKSIKVKLLDLGYHFNSESDTEVIIKAYHKWGRDCFKMFNGMFALVIFDTISNELICVRDRLGIKPFYWTFQNNKFIFGSELKSIFSVNGFNKEISKKGITEYFNNGFISSDNCIFQDVFKLQSGTILNFKIDSCKIEFHKYWLLDNLFERQKFSLSEFEALENFDLLLNDSVNLRMISDVPIGSFLSGGFDSSLITAIMQKNSMNPINTFTIGFEEKMYDESSHARQVSNFLGTNHNEYILGRNDIVNAFNLLPKVYDEPISDSSVIPTLILSNFTKKHVKVSLSADGGDELFAGYNSYKKSLNISNFLPILKQLKWVLYCIRDNSTNYDFKRKIDRVISMISSNNALEIHSNFANAFLDLELKQLLINFEIIDKYNIGVKNKLDSLLKYGISDTLIDKLLVKLDRATMYYGLEGREPLLDYRLVEFAAQLPNKYKISKGISKYLLKELTYKYIPKKLLDRPKKGFSVPLKLWLNDIFYEECMYYLDENYVNNQGIFKKDAIIIMKNNFLSKSGNYQQLWMYLNFQRWYNTWN